MQLILVRHGLPERSAVTDDPPLAAEGRDQARRLAGWLAAERIDAVFSSPMQRAVQTAEAYAAMKGCEVQIHEGVAEFDRGAGAYTPLEELKRDDYAAWRAFAEGGYEADMDGFAQRVGAGLEEIIASHPSKTVAVFCHGGVVNVWTARVLGLAPQLFFEPGYTSLHRYLCARGGQRNLVSLNETAHLRAA